MVDWDKIFVAFFFAVFFFLLYQLYLFLAPFAAPLFLAGVLVVTFAPLTPRVVKWMRGSRTAGALVMTFGVVLLVLVPLLLILTLLAAEAGHFYARIEEIRAQAVDERQAILAWLERTWLSLQGRYSFLKNVELSDVPLAASRRIAQWVAGEGQALVTGVAVTLLDASMMLVALFFLFRDGDRMAAMVQSLIPMRFEYRDRIGKTLYETVQVVVQSSLAIAVLQGIVAGLGYWILGNISVTVFLAFLTGVASLVPVVGSALIWVPTAIYVLFAEEVWRGVALFLWGGIAIGSVDNVVRPLMIGGRVQIPTFLLLFALLGGVQVYGMLGIVVAPVVVAVLMAFVEIYREHLGQVEAHTPPPQDA